MRKKICYLTTALLTSTMLLSSCGASTKTKKASSEPETKKPYKTIDISKNTTELTANVPGIKDLKDTSSDAIVMKKEHKDALAKVYQNLFANVLKDSEKDSNVLISPTSITMDFGMLENGADGNTLKELEQVINGGITYEEFNQLMYEQYKRYTSSLDLEFNIANSVWINNSLHKNAKEDFLNKAKSYYNSEVFLTPFSDSTADDINAWCNNKTKGMIQNIKPNVGPESSMHLINAIAFESEWEDEFEDEDIIEDEKFTNADNTTSTVNYLTYKDNNYFEYNGGLGFVKDYKGGEYGFFAMLPPEDLNPVEYIEKMQQENLTFADILSDSQEADVHVKMPEFETACDYQLNDTLINMGIKDSFSSANANFSKLYDDNTENNYLGSFDHFTYIKVDRTGTRAAAVSDANMALGAIEPDKKQIAISLDRPFVYGIVDLATNLPIFIGCQNSME